MSLAIVKRIWAIPLMILFWLMTRLRELFYQLGWLQTVQTGSVVLSVGNLSFGGTGKTPFLIELIKRFLKEPELKALRTALVTRGYKRQGDRLDHVVQLDHEDAAMFYGDEPTLLAEALKEQGTLVGVSEIKARMALEFSSQGIPLILIDDGFQHLRLERDLDVVLLDVSRPPSDYHLAPLGRLRETLDQIERADFIFFTKAEQKNQETDELLRKHLAGKDIGELIQKLKLPEQELAKATHIGLLAGLAEPVQFFSGVKKQLARADVKWTELSYADHYQYSKAGIDQLISQLMSQNISVVLTTVKDWVKLRRIWQHPQIRLLPVELSIAPADAKSEEKLTELVKRIKVLTLKKTGRID